MEIGITIIAASIPVLRVLVRELRWSIAGRTPSGRSRRNSQMMLPSLNSQAALPNNGLEDFRGERPILAAGPQKPRVDVASQGLQHVFTAAS